MTQEYDRINICLAKICAAVWEFNFLFFNSQLANRDFSAIDSWFSKPRVFLKVSKVYILEDYNLIKRLFNFRISKVTLSWNFNNWQQKAMWASLLIFCINFLFFPLVINSFLFGINQFASNIRTNCVCCRSASSRIYSLFLISRSHISRLDPLDAYREQRRLSRTTQPFSLLAGRDTSAEYFQQ